MGGDGTGSSGRTNGTDAWRPVDVEVRHPGVTVATPPFERKSGEEEPVWISVWQEPDEDPGMTESLLNDVTYTVCDEAPRFCERGP
jgi:hypothetical protein